MAVKKLLYVLAVALPLLSVSCVGESDYQSDTGTLSIPWGAKEGKRNDPDIFE